MATSWYGCWAHGPANVPARLHVRAQPCRGTFRGMKFSMIFEAQVEYGTPDVEREAIRNCVEQAVFAEEVGFDGVWAVEHHSLIEYSHMSAPEIFLTAVAAKTSAHPRRPRRGVHAVRVQPPGAGRGARRDARHHLRRPPQPRRRAGGTVQEMSLCGVDPELTTPQVRGGADASSATAGARTPSSGTPSS